MKIVKSESQGQSRPLYTGIFTGNVVALNPDNEKIQELIGKELKEGTEEKKYEGETKNGDKYVKLVFWLEVDGQYFTCVYMLIDKQSISETKGKLEYVNQVGQSVWVGDESELKDSFTKFTDKDKNVIENKQYREAIQGESSLYSFLCAWLNINVFNNDTNLFEDVNIKDIFVDSEKFIKKEYSFYINSEFSNPVVGMATVNTYTKADGTVAQSQKVFDRVLPFWVKPHVNKAIASKNWTDKKVSFWYNNINSNCKDVFLFDNITPYNGEALQSKDEVHTSTTENAPVTDEY